MLVVNEVAIGQAETVTAWSGRHFFLRLAYANQHWWRLVLWFDFEYCAWVNHNFAPISAAARTMARRVAAYGSEP